ncbi:MAG: hypothetical protein IJI14_14805 [Anaerolineaceae bacterium]|nr:hypothetical protein [Anaerolineaceae bacterium]
MGENAICVNDVFDGMLEGKHMSYDEKQILFGEAIREAGKKNGDPMIIVMMKKLEQSKLHGIGEQSREELIAKLGVFLGAAGVTSIPANWNAKEKKDVSKEEICTAQQTVSEGEA